MFPSALSECGMGGSGKRCTRTDLALRLDHHGDSVVSCSEVRHESTSPAQQKTRPLGDRRADWGAGYQSVGRSRVWGLKSQTVSGNEDDSDHRHREVELRCTRVKENAVVQNQGGHLCQGGDTVTQASVMWGDGLQLARPSEG